jgi:putative membrane protein
VGLSTTTSLLAHAGSADHAFDYHAHPEVWAVMLAVVGLYVYALRYIGPGKVVPGEPIVTRRKALLFGLGVLALWIHADWPIHDLGEGYLFSVHMIQHTGFALIAPPLLLLGMPGWMTRWLFLDNPRVHWVTKRVLRPLPAALLYNVVTVVTHSPPLVDASLESHPLHFAIHIVIFLSAAAMWFSVVNSVPGLPTMSPPIRMVYLFLQSVIPTIPASFLTFSESPMYSFYEGAARVWGLSPVDDQQLAGAVMKVYAGMLLWGVIIGVFFRWYASEQTPRRKPEAVLTWDEVERELERTGPPTT